MIIWKNPEPGSSKFDVSYVVSTSSIGKYVVEKASSRLSKEKSKYSQIRRCNALRMISGDSCLARMEEDGEIEENKHTSDSKSNHY
mmetsp:Transcript_2186/g.3491  ORF Transcript_2186/g.3491 Transcript_2186/m.3491 type:complete len:86 (-) Transcript_2186:1539-1796(-)